MIGFHHLINYR
jgi:hypothetical protein